MKKSFLVCTLLLLGLQTLRSQEVINMMFYNILRYPTVGDPSRIDDLQAILEFSEPDLFMICELNNETGANNIETMMQTLNPNYVAAPYWDTVSDDTGNNSNELQNLIFYDNTKFILEDQDVVVTYLRDFNHYTLKLNTVNQSTDPILIHVFVCHLKASSGSTNEQLRLDMALDFTTYLNSLNSDAHVILAGDFNVYSDNEPAYQEFLNQNNVITLHDPAERPGEWHNNVDFIDVWSQSTHATAGGSYSSGGFDDRFDFILASGNVLDGSIFSYVQGSYVSVGNNLNPNCFNQSINSSDCDGVLYDLALREHLFNMSDHLPIQMQLSFSDNFLNMPSYELNNKDFELEFNQVEGILKVEVNSRIFGNESYLLIYNIMGQLISETSVGTDNTIFIQTDSLAAGQYMLKSNLSDYPPQKFIKY